MHSPWEKLILSSSVNFCHPSVIQKQAESLQMAESLFLHSARCTNHPYVWLATSTFLMELADTSANQQCLQKWQSLMGLSIFTYDVHGAGGPILPRTCVGTPMTPTAMDLICNTMTFTIFPHQPGCCCKLCNSFAAPKGVKQAAIQHANLT
jgi:hypothetical protein